MTDVGSSLFAWFATAWLHGAALFVLIWGAERLGLLRRPLMRQTAWRAVLLAPLLSAALQVFVLGGSPIGRETLTLATPATPSVTADARAAAPPAVAMVAPAQSASIAAAEQPSARRRAAQDAPSFLGLAWLGWMAIAAAWLAVQAGRLVLYRRGLAPVRDADTLAVAERLRRRAGLAEIVLLEHPDLTSPLSVAPSTIVLPAWTRTLSELQRAAMLAHEAHHLRRRDPQWRGLTLVAALALLAPWAKVALDRLEALSEDACDAWSAAQVGGGAPLAECLFACVEHGLDRRTPMLAAAMAVPQSPVVDRVRRLVEDRVQGFESDAGRERAAFAIVLGLAVIALPDISLGHGSVSPSPAVAGVPQVATARLAAPSSVAPAVRRATHRSPPHVVARPVASAQTATTAVPAIRAQLATAAQPAVPAQEATPAIKPVPASPAVAAFEPVTKPAAPAQFVLGKSILGGGDVI